MSVYDEPQGADPRALLSAAALGSVAGLVLGGGYLLSAHLAAPLAPSIQTVPGLTSTASLAPSQDSRRDAGRPDQAQASTPFGLRVPLRLLPFAAEPFHRAVDTDTAHDRTCLTQAVYYEARGEAAEGQQAVAQVVLNRLRHPAFPKSVCGVVFQRSVDGCQFSFACESHAAIGRDAAAWRRADRVAQQALDGFVMRRVGRATNFHVSTLATQWSQGLAQIAQIGAHVFYGFGSHASGAPYIVRRAEPAPSAAAAAPPPLTVASLGAAGEDRVHVTLIQAKLELPAAAMTPTAVTPAPAAETRASAPATSAVAAPPSPSAPTSPVSASGAPLKPAV